MCIIALPVDSVGATQIFVAPNSSKTKQITVYSNVVSNSSRNNAMILPVPFPGSVDLVDLSNYKDLFVDCKSCFKAVNTSYNSDSPICRGRTCNGSGTLKVHEVGGYLASIAMSIQDIQRADASVFTLEAGCATMLAKEYSDPKYGFIICKLAEGDKEYHPFAYTHDMDNNRPTNAPSCFNLSKLVSHLIYNNRKVKKDTRDTRDTQLSLFIPTKHYHHNKRKAKTKIMFGIDPSKEEFDHDIYVYNGVIARFNSLSPVFVLDDSKTEYVTRIQSKLPFNMGECRDFHRYKVCGYYDNIDLTATVV